ncbi:MAG: hypothetical protein HZB98_13960 [Bacteroidia bacterium]|nr:hypothetical protein [Bacteroidia bacterium]
MDNSIALLSVTAVSLGFLHTLLGPDHYLPFIVISLAKKWSLKKTIKRYIYHILSVNSLTARMSR